MSQVRIGAASRIADRNGTHEPGDVIDGPSQALLDLATAKTLDPETGAPYAEIVGQESPTPKTAKAAPDATEKAS